MNSVHLFTIPARLLVWAGIVFFGGIAYAQGKDADTVHIFKVDTVRLGFEDVLQFSVQYDSADKDDWHYIYRWNTGERTDAMQVKFNGKRKVLYTGQRLSAIHWPGECDTFQLDEIVYKDIYHYVVDSKDDMVVLRAPDMEGVTVRYEWSNDLLYFVRLLPDTEQCMVVYRDMWWTRYEGMYFSCRVTAVSAEGDTTVLLSCVSLYFFDRENDGLVQKPLLVQTPAGRQLHVYNIWSMPKYSQIYARLGDTLRFFSELTPDLYPDEYADVADLEFTRYIWVIYPCREKSRTINDSAINIYFKDLYRNAIHVSNGYLTPTGAVMGVGTGHHIYWGIKPDAEIETDSVWVFFPQYPYSNLGGVVDVCLPPDAPLPSPDDTIQTFNLGPWNRELDYVEYAWFDGTKDILGHDSVVGKDSAFAYLFGRMDSVSPYLYAGRVVTRVAADSLWQDSCQCFVPCTDAACNRYDTVHIYLHRLPEHNTFFPRDTFLCAHQDLSLQLPDTEENYRCFWLDKDSIEMPYGHDTARFTIQGMRGLDGFGVGTDTREPRLFQLRLEHKLCGVSYFDTLRVTDIVKPVFTLPYHDTIICLNEPVELDSLSPLVHFPAYTFAWTDGEKGSSRTFTDSGDYVLQFFVKEVAASCGYDTATDTVHVLWSDPAMTIITLPADTGFCPKLSVTLDASVPCASTRYEWRMGTPLDEEDYYNDFDSVLSTLPTRTFKEEGTFNISLIDTLNCRNVKEINITEDDCTPKLDIPNVFTPNGDGVNDVWRFKQLESCRDVVVEVVDRWGQPVLKQKVPSADAFEWNGTMHGKGRLLPDGPYFYMVSYKDVYGKRHTQSGSVTILGTAE